MAGFGYALLTRPTAKPPPEARPPAPIAATAAPRPALDLGPPSPPPSLSAAFKLVYPKPEIDSVANGRARRLLYRPVVLQRISNDTFALVSTGQDLAAAITLPTGLHAASGYATIAYVTVRHSLALVGQPRVISESDGGWGQPPSVHLLPRLSKTPVLEVEGSFSNFGESDAYVELFALGPTVADVKPVSDKIPVEYAFGYGEGCDIEGKIAPVTPDQAFDVRYSGSYHGRQRYVLSKGTWTPSPPLPDEGLSALCAAARRSR